MKILSEKVVETLTYFDSGQVTGSESPSLSGRGAAEDAELGDARAVDAEPMIETVGLHRAQSADELAGFRRLTTSDKEHAAGLTGTKRLAAPVIGFKSWHPPPLGLRPSRRRVYDRPARRRQLNQRGSPNSPTTLWALASWNTGGGTHGHGRTRRPV